MQTVNAVNFAKYMESEAARSVIKLLKYREVRLSLAEVKSLIEKGEWKEDDNGAILWSLEGKDLPKQWRRRIGDRSLSVGWKGNCPCCEQEIEYKENPHE